MDTEDLEQPSLLELIDILATEPSGRRKMLIRMEIGRRVNDLLALDLDSGNLRALDVAVRGWRR